MKQTNEELLDCIIVAQSKLADESPAAVVFDSLLSALLGATDSEFGFIGEVLTRRDGKQYVCTRAVCDVSWDEDTRRLYATQSATGLEFTHLDNLFGHVVSSAKPVIVNAPVAEVNGAGLPAGHPPLRSFLGLPLFRAGKLVGIAGVANRDGGYDDELVEFVEPLVTACANTVAILRTEDAHRRAEQRAEEHLREVTTTQGHLLQVLEQLQVGFVVLDQHMRIAHVGDAPYLEEVRRADVVGHHWSSAFAGNSELCQKLAGVLAAAVPTEQKFHTPWMLRSGARFYLELEVREDPRNPEGRIIYFYDLTELVSLRERETRRGMAGLIGESPPMVALFQHIHEVASGDWDVLIEGETGSGKEMVARAVHSLSSRRDAPYIPVNCAGLSDELLASQLFGHRHGAFTGAVRDQQGLFDAADGGTLFLDEIGDVSPKLQVSLLRAIQEREILRVGDTRPHKVNVRILSASHRDLSKLEGFRADLLYRIRTARLRVPPLRERRGDIPLLCCAFLASDRATAGRTATSFSDECMRALCDYSWPGNVRELKAAVRHCLIHSHGTTIEASSLPPEIANHIGGGAGTAARQKLQSMQIVDALRRAHGNRTKAARILGIGRATLYRRMRALGVDELARRGLEDGPEGRVEKR